ncbi:flagellar basal body L-ring protein FlgH [bacterium]|nr:flagellar basal body L-ring protein FlgH [bacterium]
MFKSNFIFAVIFLAGFSESLLGAPLWLTGRDLYSSKNSRVYHPGDIITVLIAEEATAQQAASTNTQDDSQLEVKSSPAIPFFQKAVSQFLGKNEVKNGWKGNGTTTRSGKLTGTVTATVLEVFSNGNLLIEGSRSIRVNREAQIMRVRGVARPRDIDMNNSINSKLLADAEVKYEGKGTVGSVQKPGLMTRIANFIF